MKKTIKRLLGLLLVISLVVGMMPSLVMAKTLQTGTASKIYEISELNTVSNELSHKTDYQLRAYIETNFRETIELNSVEEKEANVSRYDHAYNPRMKKVNDSLYILLWQHTQEGQHIYWAQSTNGEDWGNPEIFWRGDLKGNTVTLSDGTKNGEMVGLKAAEPSICVVGDKIYVVYTVFPNGDTGEAAYSQYNGIYMRVGTVGADNAITWGEPQHIYKGYAQAPVIQYRNALDLDTDSENGVMADRLEVYFTSKEKYIQQDYTVENSPSVIGLVVSYDLGQSWIPDNSNNIPKTIFKQDMNCESFPTSGDAPTPVTIAAPNGEDTYFYGGQMPAVFVNPDGRTQLYAVVKDTDGSLSISTGASATNGRWEELVWEKGSRPNQQNVGGVAALYPSVVNFPSGETYLTFIGATDNSFYGVLGSASGSIDSNYKLFEPAYDDVTGYTGSAELVDSHEVINVVKNNNGSNSGIRLTHSYLNHRINAGKTPVTVGGDTTEWANITTDALFVGSACQAQVTMQVTQDDDNIYLLLNRLDNDLRITDYVRVCIADEKDSKSYYDLTLYVGGSKPVVLKYRDNGASAKETNLEQYLSVARTIKGSVEDGVANNGNDTGAVFEVAIPKSLVGLTGKTSFKTRLALRNMDWDVDAAALVETNDSFEGVNNSDTTYWPVVVLDCQHTGETGDVCSQCGEELTTHSDGEHISTNKYVSVDADGNYTLNLEAYGLGSITSTSYVKPADIVLVLDDSASMYSPAGASGNVARYQKGSTDIQVDYSHTVTGEDNVVWSEMDITGYALEKVDGHNVNVDTEKGKHLGYYIAQSSTTRAWFVMKYLDGEDFSPTYKNYTGWVGYRLDHSKGTGSVIDANVLDPTYTTSAKQVLHVSSDKTLPFDRLTIWKTQYGALYDAVTGFMSDLKKSGVDHRVAITTFCGLAHSYTRVYDGANILKFWDLYEGSGETGSYTYANDHIEAAEANLSFLEGAMNRVQVTSEYKQLKKTMETIVTNGANTAPAAGMAMANAVLHANYYGNETMRDRFVLLFTDGSPNRDMKGLKQVSSARNDTVVQAAIAKQQYGATVFSIYTSTVSAVDNRPFLRVTSSMYPDATRYAYEDSDGWHRDSAAWGEKQTDREYCFQATSEDDLKIAFTNISSSMATPATNLDATAVLRDVLSDYFDLRDASGDGTISAKDITVFTSRYLGNNEFDVPIPFTTAKVELGHFTVAGDDDASGEESGGGDESEDESEGGSTEDGSTEGETETVALDAADTAEIVLANAALVSDGRLNSISVSNFSYVDNYVHENADNADAGGKKLIVKIPIKVRDGFWGGNSVPTNKSDDTGVYAVNNLGMTKVMSLPLPELNVQATPVVQAQNISLYYGGSASWSNLLTGIKVGGVGVTVTNDGTCTPSETWMDDYAAMSWTGYDQAFNNKTPGSYAFRATLTPNAVGAAIPVPVLGVDEVISDDTRNQSVAAATASTAADSGYIHILTPVLTFEDTTVHTGFAPNEDYFNKNNFVDSIYWINENGETAGGVIVGEEPTLTLEYLYTFSFGQDMAVNVTVTSSNGNEDITSIVTFKWNLCAEHKGQAVIADHKGSAESYEFWIHMSETKAMDDAVVIDFGLKVEIDVIKNDIQSTESGYTLLGISKDTVAANFGTSLVSGAFGTLTMEGDKVVYTPGTMAMNAPEVFYYVAQCEYGLFYGTITVIPATTVYYEDDFAGGVSYEVYKYDQTGKTWNKDESSQWQIDGTASDAIQGEDRPGSGSEYGSDAAYDNSAAYSMGAAHYIVVDSSTYGLATFIFCGTGFDIISRTSADTGFITVNVYKIEGETKTRVQRLGVDTYYSSADGLYQIPVMKVEGLAYGVYEVEIKSAYNTALDHKKDDAGYSFYLDAVRIYDPVGVLAGESNDTVSGAYDADQENYPVYEEIRNTLINAGSFGELTVESEGASTQITGSVFVDLTDGAGASNGIKDYQDVGPNNEVYLAPGQSIAFNIGKVFVNEAGNTVSPVDVQIGLKSVNGSVGVELFNPAVSTSDNTTVYTKSNVISRQINTATEMYYSIAQLKDNTIVITNSGESGNLSITNLKLTFDEKVTATVESAQLLSISEDDAVTVLRSLSGYSYSTEEEKTLPTITPTGASVSLEDEINYNVMFSVSNPDNLEITEMGLISWFDKIDGTMDDAAFVSVGAVVYGTDGWQVQSQPIAAKDMGQELYFKVYVKLADGSYVYSRLLHCSTKTYCTSILADENAEDGLKALCVAMMNYGAAAQTYFGYKTDELMNADLTDEQKALVSGYTSDMVPALVPAGEKGAGLSGNGGYTYAAPSVTLGGALAINYYFTPGFTADNGMKLYVWTAEDYARLESLTLENAAQVLTMTADGDSYVGSVTDIAAKNAGDTVYVCGVYECNGVSYYTGVLACSVSAYCKSFENGSTDVWPLASATAVYGYYANAYFG